MEPSKPVNQPEPGFARRIRLSALLVAAGLLGVIISLYWSHPLAFMTFAGSAALLVGGGVLVYLLALLRYR